MTLDPSGNQEPEKAKFHFPKGQGVRIFRQRAQKMPQMLVLNPVL